MMIREAKQSDIEPMVTIWKQYISNTEPFFDQFVNEKSLDENSIINYKTSLLEYFNDDRKFCLVSRIDDQITGYIYGEILDNKSIFRNQIGYIVDLMIDNKFRRKGLGVNLLNSAKSWFSKNKIKKISIQVRSENNVAIQFWEKLGFEERIKKMYLDLN